MKRIEIDECSEQCPWLKGNGTFCYITRRSITGFNKRTGFPDWCPLPDVEGLKAERELLIEQNQHLQNEIKDCHELLNIMKVPTNGIDSFGYSGEGKRENLSLHQRISFLKYLPDVEEKKEEKGSYKDNFPKISPDDFAKARDSIGLRFNR